MIKSKPKTEIKTTTMAIGLALLLTLGLTLCIGAPLMLLGVSVTPLHLVGGFVAAMAVVGCFASLKRTALSAVATIAIFAVAVFVASRAIDVSFDGNGYHQEIVNALAFDGWNPFLNYQDTDSMQVWTLHYAKGVEWLAACVSCLVGVLECGKAVNLLLAIAAGLICCDVLADVYRDLSLPKRAIVLALMVLNPVAMGQGLTFYIDYAFYYYMIITVALSVEIFNQRNVAVNYIALVVTVAMAVATKFNAFFMEGCVIVALLLGYWLYRRQLFAAEVKRYVAVLFTATLIASVLICWHPYVTNIITHGHPLYPLMGGDALDIMSNNTPEYYGDGNRVVNFLRSVYAVQRPSVDQRVGGFGPLFGLVFTISVLWMAFAAIKQRRISPLTYCSIVAVLFCMIFEQSWWARYNTQLWLLPIFALLSSSSYPERIGRCVFAVLAAAVISNVAICGACAVMKSIEATSYRSAIYEEFSGKTIYMTQMRSQWRRQLAEHNIQERHIDLNEVDMDYTLNYTSNNIGDVETDPLIALTAQQRQRIDSAYQSSPVVRIFKKFANKQK